MEDPADLVLTSDSAFSVVDVVVEFAGTGRLLSQLTYAIEEAAQVVAAGYLDRDEFAPAVCALSIAIALRDGQPPPDVLAISAAKWSSLRSELSPSAAKRLLVSMAGEIRAVLVASQDPLRADVPFEWRGVSPQLADSLGLTLPAPPLPADVLRRLDSSVTRYFVVSLSWRGATVSLAQDDGHGIASVVIVKPEHLCGSLSGTVSRTELRERDGGFELLCWDADGERPALTVRGSAVVVQEQ